MSSSNEELQPTNIIKEAQPTTSERIMSVGDDKSPSQGQVLSQSNSEKPEEFDKTNIWKLKQKVCDIMSTVEEDKRMSPEHGNGVSREQHKYEGHVGSLSPTSSSSYSSQGSSTPIKAKLAHGLSFSQPAEKGRGKCKEKDRSNPVATIKYQNTFREPSAGENSIPTQKEGIKQKTSTTIHQTKRRKGRSSSTTGRPRSNSVPFDFHSPKPSSLNRKSTQLRRGKWTAEEEAYVARVIQDFNSGYLDAPPGTTLRTYLSDKLNCDPMRITKKFTGDSCIGKRVFHPAVRCSSNAASIDKAQSELDSLERRWRKRLDMQQKETAKKQAASAAAAAAAVSGRTLHGKALHTLLGNNGNRAVVAQTASWLDRANAILAHPYSKTWAEQESKIVKSNSDEVEKEMKEVKQLIHEGPIIQQTSAGLPTLLQQETSPPTNPLTINSTSTNDASSKRKVSDDTSTVGVCIETADYAPLHVASSEDNVSRHSRFNDKRMRRSFSHNNIQDQEDAATLMGFLSSVRQAAESSSLSSK